MQVANCLLELGRAKMANEVLSKAPHFFHPKEGKAGKLPSIYLEYRLIPYISLDIIPLGFDKQETIEKSRVLRSRFLM